MKRSGQVKDQQEDGHAADGCKGLDGDNHPKKGGDAFTAPEICPNGKDMAGYGRQSQSDHKIRAFGFVMKVVGNEDVEAGGDNSFEHVDCHYQGTPAGTKYPEGIGRAGVSAAVFPDIDPEE